MADERLTQAANSLRAAGCPTLAALVDGINIFGLSNRVVENAVSEIERCSQAIALTKHMEGWTPYVNPDKAKAGK